MSIALTNTPLYYKDEQGNYQPVIGAINLSNYIAKTGGIMTGSLLFQNPQNKLAGIKFTNDNNTNLDIGWDYTNRNGAGFTFHSTNDSQSGYFHLYARNNINTSTLEGKPNGELNWVSGGNGDNTNPHPIGMADEVGIIITGKRPAVVVSADQYVIVRGSTINGITDGLYMAVNALSPSTDVSAADLTAVSDGGLNYLRDMTAQFVDKQSHIDSLFDIPSGIINIRLNQLDSNTIGVPSAIANDLATNPWQLIGGWQSNGYYKGLIYTPSPTSTFTTINSRMLFVWGDGLISEWTFLTPDGNNSWTS